MGGCIKKSQNEIVEIRNKQNSIQVRDLASVSITPEAMELIRNNMNMEMHSSPDQGAQDLLKLIRDESDTFINPINPNSDPDSFNSDLIRGIQNKSVSIYSIGENGDVFRE